MKRNPYPTAPKHIAPQSYEQVYADYLDNGPEPKRRRSTGQVDWCV